MTFKDNLLKKIKIDRLVGHITLTIGPADSERRLDKTLMRQLLALSPLKPETERDLELYRLPGSKPEKEMILVLDNDLAVYRTTVDDVAMRKSPTVKEMVSIRNAIKILNDKDVVISKKENSLLEVQKMCLEMLDLSYARADLAAIAAEGRAALELKDAAGVIESLSLFAELTGYITPPAPFKIDHHYLIGKTHKPAPGEVVCGPLVLYDEAKNTLKLMEKAISSRDKAALDTLRRVAGGEEEAAADGVAVIAFLENLAAEKMPVFQPAGTPLSV
ncbi:MAG: hypothetical protein V2B19_26665 [Pseudomonadota bacterium]